ncbi:MAG: hypothetical protein AMXMBFR84_13130 [Candidatus Hydrogenedentota bacterium]
MRSLYAVLSTIAKHRLLAGPFEACKEWPANLRRLWEGVAPNNYQTWDKPCKGSMWASLRVYSE